VVEPVQRELDAVGSQAGECLELAVRQPPALGSGRLEVVRIEWKRAKSASRRSLCS
jgi:hypothetical protein